MSCGIGHILCSVSPIPPLAWELPYVAGVALKKAEKKKKKKKVLSLSFLASGLVESMQSLAVQQTSFWLRLLYIQGFVCWVFISLPSSC